LGEGQNDLYGVVVTDLDGTSRAESLFLEGFLATVQAGLFSEEIKNQVEEIVGMFQQGCITFLEYETKLFWSYYNGLKGVSHLRYIQIIKDVVRNGYQKNIFKYTFNLLKQKKDQGWCICFNSASIYFEVDAFCRAWQFDFSFGSVPQIGADGLYTGHNISNIKQEKVLKIKFLLAKEEFSGIDPRNILVIGDSMFDYEMMQYVALLGGQVICFNPSAELRKLGLGNHWEIVDDDSFVEGLR